MLWSQEACFRYLQEQALALHMLAGCTADRELHPAPKVEYLVDVIIATQIAAVNSFIDC
jgi:hypothetical protein